MIDVIIDLNLSHRGPSDGLLNHLYECNYPIDPLAAGGSIIIGNQTEKVLYPQTNCFINNAKSIIEHHIEGNTFIIATIRSPGTNHVSIRML